MRREDVIGKVTEVVVGCAIIGAMSAVIYSGVLPRACDAFANLWAQASDQAITGDPVTGASAYPTTGD